MGIIGTIASILPDWFTSIIVAALLWFGVNYIFLAKYHFEDVHRNYNKNVVSCSKDIFEAGFQNDRSAMALFTSSFGMMENETALIKKACSE